MLRRFCRQTEDRVVAVANEIRTRDFWFFGGLVFVGGFFFFLASHEIFKFH